MKIANEIIAHEDRRGEYLQREFGFRPVKGHNDLFLLHTPEWDLYYQGRTFALCVREHSKREKADFIAIPIAQKYAMKLLRGVRKASTFLEDVEQISNNI